MVRFPGYRRAKYAAERTRGYASKAEAERADQLRLLEKAGVITDLREQPVYDVEPAGCARISYRADFAYWEGPRLIVEDTKGFATPVWKLKAKLFRHRYPDVTLRVSRRTSAGAFHIEDATA